VLFTAEQFTTIAKTGGVGVKLLFPEDTHALLPSWNCPSLRNYILEYLMPQKNHYFDHLYVAAPDWEGLTELREAEQELERLDLKNMPSLNTDATQSLL